MIFYDTSKHTKLVIDIRNNYKWKLDIKDGQSIKIIYIKKLKSKVNIRKKCRKVYF